MFGPGRWEKDDNNIIGAQRLARILLLYYIVGVQVPFCTVERFAQSYYIIIILFFSTSNMINKQKGLLLLLVIRFATVILFFLLPTTTCPYMHTIRCIRIMFMYYPLFGRACTKIMFALLIVVVQIYNVRVIYITRLNANNNNIMTTDFEESQKLLKNETHVDHVSPASNDVGSQYNLSETINSFNSRRLPFSIEIRKYQSLQIMNH